MSNGCLRSPLYLPRGCPVRMLVAGGGIGIDAEGLPGVAAVGRGSRTQR